MEELRGLIRGLKVNYDSKAVNVDTALKFIEEYMYNTSQALGKSLIKEDLCPYLNIQDYKSLINFHGELFRKVNRERKEKENKKEREVLQEFPWYEEKEKGLRFLPFILAKHLKEEIKCYYCAESFFIYSNGVYKQGGEREASKIIMKYMLPKHCTMAYIRDCREQWEILICRDFEDFNSNPYIVNVKNGLIDIRDFTFKEHSFKYLSTVQLNVEYKREKECKRFREFLSEVLDKRIIPLVQEIFGYLLTTNTACQKAFVFFGPARTGKSTLIWVLEYLLLGRNNVSNIPLQEIGDRFKTAELLGKLANVFSDLPSKEIYDTGVFKGITGEDYLMGEKKNKNPFKFKPFARLLFSCNELPKNYVDRTEGFYRRLILIPFTTPIKEEKIDKNLKEKLKEEKEGILNWALQGLKRLYENNFEFSENVLTDNLKEEYRRENNNVIYFVYECCNLRAELLCSSIELYETYREFCEKLGLKALSHIKFNRELERNFTLFKGRESNRRLWKGIALKEEDIIEF